MAVALGDLQRYDEALAILQEVMDKDASILEAYDSMGYVYYKKGDFASAAQQYNKILELDGQNAKAKNSLAILERDLNG